MFRFAQHDNGNCKRSMRLVVTPWRRSFLPLQTIAVLACAVVARVLNQSHAFFPNDLFEMTVVMVLIVNAYMVFYADCRFPLTIFMTEFHSGNSVDVHWVKFWG